MKILVINTKFLGDLILTAPGLAALREKEPDAEIVLLARGGYETALENDPNINSIIPFDFGIKKKNIAERLKAEINFIRLIRSHKFDCVIALHPGDRIAFLAWFSGARIRIAPFKQPFNFLFTKLVDVEEDSISYQEYYNRLISAYTGNPVNSKTGFPVPEKNKLWAEEFLSQRKTDKKNIVIGIHPGASEPTKIWPAENFMLVIKKLLYFSNVKILLIAGPSDNEIVGSIVQKVNSSRVLFYHSTDVNLTAALMERCSIFISNDTGTRHLSVALKIPVVALMPEDNQKCWNFYDESDNHFVLTGKRIYPQYAKPYLGEISVDDVYVRTKNYLKL